MPGTLRTSRRGRTVLIGTAAVALMAGGLLLRAELSGPAPAHGGTHRSDIPAASQPVSRAVGNRSVATLTADDAVVATAPHGIAWHRSPGGPAVLRLSAHTSLGSVRTLLVLRRRADGWLEVQLPGRPNQATGWVRRSDVRLSTDPWSIRIDRRSRSLILLRAGAPMRRYPVAVGAGATPTPSGLFYVTEKVTISDAAGAFGPAALGLSAHSTVLHHFDGGDGIIGIHGTDADGSVGMAVSHGCIRLHDDQVMSLYRRVPLGTPVRIV